MKRYIQGNYAPTRHLLKILANDNKRKILEALLNSYPASMNIEGIAKCGVSKSIAYSYSPNLAEDELIKRLEEEKGGSDRYVIENVNSLLRDRYDSLAPGNVKYSPEFESALNKLINEVEIKDQCMTLFGFVKYIVESVNESDEEDLKRIAPKKDTDYVCSQCGLNHEARDFIRATLLYLVDQFERSLSYLEFLGQERYVDEKHYEEYYKLIQENLAKGKSEIEQHRTTNVSQELLRLRIVSMGISNYFYGNAEYISCLATNVNGGLIPVAVHKSLITKMIKVDSVIECVPSAILNNAVFLAKDNPHLRVLPDANSLLKFESIPIKKIESILPTPGGMEIISGIIEANVVANPYEKDEVPRPEQSRLLINDGTGEAGLALKASFDSQIDSLNSYPGSCMPSLIDWRLDVDDRIKIVGATSVNDPFYEGVRLTIELQPYSSLSVLKNGTFEQLEYEWGR